MGDALEAIEDGLTEEEQALIDADEAGAESEESEEKTETDSEEEKPAGAEEEEGTKGELEAEEEAKTKTQQRIDELTARSKTAEEKLDLFKRDQDAYFQQYPDEKPHEERFAQGSDDYTLASGMVVTGGPHDGKTLQEVMDVDPISGNILMNEHFHAQRVSMREEEKEKAKEAEKSQREVDDFMLARAKELYPGKDKDFTQSEMDTLNKSVSETLDWMQKTGRGFANLEDAHYLMNRDKDIVKAKSDGAKAIADQAIRGSVQTISSSASSGTETGYEADMAMSAQELSDKVEKMGEKAYTEWVKDAPKELKAKHPDLPW